MSTNPETTRRQSAPRFSISQISTLGASFENQDIRERPRPDVGALMGALDAAGWDGLYDLEIFSDDGTFGSAYPDSLWALPAADLARQGRTALLAAWQGRQMLVPALTDPLRKEDV